MQPAQDHACRAGPAAGKAVELIGTSLSGYPQLRLANASDDEFFAGLVSFEPVKGDLKGVLAELAARNVRVAVVKKRPDTGQSPGG